MSGPDARQDTDLAQIEAALADGRATAADPRERELQELALALRSDSPEPARAFAQDLDRRVSEGFPKARRAPVALRRRWMPVLAGAAALILIAVVSISVLGNRDRVSVSSSAGLETSPKAAPDLRQFATPPTASSAAPTAAAGRRVERSARLTISTSRDKLQGAADGVGTVAESHRGFVLSSQVNTGDAGSPGGSFVLRVPATELQAALADLSKLGRMRARSESGLDMTASYNNVQNRLGNALLERSALKLRLRRAHGRKADDIRLRIAALNASIDGLNGRMNDLRKRTVYSTVYVSLEQDAAGAGGSSGSGGTGAAWHDAVHTLEALLNFMVRALGVLLPLGLLAGIGVIGSRSLRRRRREAALM
jgi:hypothetical protein